MSMPERICCSQHCSFPMTGSQRVRPASALTNRPSMEFNSAISCSEATDSPCPRGWLLRGNHRRGMARSISIPIRELHLREGMSSDVDLGGKIAQARAEHAKGTSTHHGPKQSYPRLRPIVALVMLCWAKASILALECDCTRVLHSSASRTIDTACYTRSSILGQISLRR